MISIDQLGREVFIKEKPKRIISLVPSITELLFDLGLSSKIVGVTKFCTHPIEASQIEKVGGTKTFDFEKIKCLEPDLIICNKEENYKDGVEALIKDYSVWVSDVDDLKSCLEMISSIGLITGTCLNAENVIDDISSEFKQLVPCFNKDALYLIWRKPYMAAAGGTFIDCMLRYCGFNNVLKSQIQYPIIKPAEMDRQPELILLSSEPYPFTEKHVSEIQNHFPNSDVLLVDGEMFSWFGSRMKYSPKYFSKLYQVYCANSTKRD